MDKWEATVRDLEDLEDAITRLRTEMEIAVLKGYPVRISVEKPKQE